jgi:hypothetical protein
MLLHRTNFTIQARFSFTPFEAGPWVIRTAKLLNWRENLGKYGRDLILTLRLPLQQDEVQDDVQIGTELDVAAILGPNSMPDKTSSFPIFLCEPSLIRRGDKTKNAWAMRSDLLNMEVNTEPVMLQNMLQFLNKWGAWWESAESEPDPIMEPFIKEMNPLFGFSIAFPYLMLNQREEYRRALLPKNAGAWLGKSDPLQLTQGSKPPYFYAERKGCQSAIEATITIDHLAGRRFGFCRRKQCGHEFQLETRHQKNYCSKSCMNADNVARWREKQDDKKSKSRKAI